MNELYDLYQEILLDHYKRPRNFGPLPGCDHEADGHNPLCGDRIHVRIKLAGDRLDEVRFEGSGCAISTASASMMTEAVRGKSRSEAEALFDRFRALVTGDGSAPADEELGELVSLGGVREFPMRVKCATLAWHTLKAALDQPGAIVSTEDGR
ncbi:MAG TPA: SUF system NifU family Fe-S cluster assembly protein [Thermoanaerobaculia bacterium]|nr:SUF system NifU family Fe-S cluster assembly protein [Thermoanaerobaculia bacterium]